MRLFLVELRKIWDWKILLVIAALSVGVFFAFLRPGLPAIAETGSGMYGPFQAELYDQYGDTLEAGEWADFDVDGKLDELQAQVEEQMASDPIFAKYGLVTWQDLQDWVDVNILGNPAQTEFRLPSGESIGMDQVVKDYSTMMSLLLNAPVEATGDGWTMTGLSDYGSPWWLIQSLRSLQDRYEDAGSMIQRQEASPSPVVRERASAFRDHQSNLIDYSLTPGFSPYAAVTGILVVLSVMLLVAPLMTRDRATKVASLQYSSHDGRIIVQRQLVAVAVSSLLIALIQTGLSWSVFFAATGAGKYWGAHIADMDVYFFMENMTFGGYVLAMTAMIVAQALAMGLAAFALSLRSTSMVTMFVKLAPVTVVLGAIAGLGVFLATSVENFFFLLVTRETVALPEFWVCGITLTLGAIVAAVLARRERGIDC